jgi:hypothetical protein
MQTSEAVASPPLSLRVGQLVEVRGEDEILATLDANAMLEDLPFMPEMVRFCGRQFRVGAVAHKLCDTQSRTGMRRMHDAVHLAGAAARCDGGGHDGCQADCLLYWKLAWLKPVDGPARETDPADPAAHATSRLLPLLVATTRREPLPDGTESFRCQATELLRAAPESLPTRDLGQYVHDVRTGNVSVAWSSRAFLVGLFNRIQGITERRLPGALRFRGGRPWKFLRGRAGAQTPTAHTNLQPGEWVRVRSKREIEATLNDDLLNRGLGFDSEMSRFCGRTARVARRVDRIIDEKTGKMLRMRNPCIVLEGVVCEGAYHASCPRAIPSYWREIWLERVEEPV